MNKFGFFIHPLDMRDIIRYEPKAAHKRPELVDKIFEWLPPNLTSEISGIKSLTGKEIGGYFINVPFLPHHFTSLPRAVVYEKIIKGGKIAESLGAKILGLGGFTSVVGDAGYTIAKHLSIPVTSGNSYTIATALEATVYAASLLGIDLNRAKTAVIGATGSIGSTCARILAPQVKNLTLIARTVKRLKQMAELIAQESGITPVIETDIQTGLRNADIIISATSSSGGIILPEYLSPGCLICDVSLPHDVCREVATLRPDVLVIEGGVVKVPGKVQFNFDFGYPDGVSLACMAETMILTLEERFENFSIGRGIHIDKVQEISRMAKKHGFSLAGLRSFDQPLSMEYVKKVKAEASKKK